MWRALPLLLATLACHPDAPADSVLSDLDRLAFIPAGQLTYATGAGNVVFQVREPLLFDRFEVRREDWLARQPQLGPVAPELAAAISNWPSTERDRPATFVSCDEAERYARTRGMRLPTAGEWIYVSAGPQRLPYPWGATAQKGVANTLELSLGRLSPCGAFESGRSPQGVYDLHGNAAEWVSDLAPIPDRALADERVSVLGGSFRSYSRPLLVGDAEPLGRIAARRTRSDDVGFRCCVEAESYLWRIASEVRADGETREQLFAIGRRWGRRALPLLSELSTRSGAPTALRILAEGASQ